MIRISIHSLRYKEISDIIKSLLQKNEIEYKEDSLDIKRQYDINIIEVKSIDDLYIIDKLKRNEETLIYIIGPESFELANMCIKKNVHLYIIKNELNNEFNKNADDIIHHIQTRFQCYNYTRNGIESKMRLSHIQYIETLGHNIVIHSKSGQFVERKKLTSFLNEISSNDFIQIHKSYVVNKKHISKITGNDVTIKNGDILPIGRVYKDALKA